MFMASSLIFCILGCVSLCLKTHHILSQGAECDPLLTADKKIFTAVALNGSKNAKSSFAVTNSFVPSHKSIKHPGKEVKDIMQNR